MTSCGKMKWNESQYDRNIEVKAIFGSQQSYSVALKRGIFLFVCMMSLWVLWFFTECLWPQTANGQTPQSDVFAVTTGFRFKPGSDCRSFKILTDFKIVLHHTGFFAVKSNMHPTHYHVRGSSTRPHVVCYLTSGDSTCMANSSMNGACQHH